MSGSAGARGIDLQKKAPSEEGSSGYSHYIVSFMKQVGIPVEVRELTSEITELVKTHPHGYGKNVNPCIDCRILQQKIAKEYMEEIGADFIITGEVIGQRPMSQHKPTIGMIEREAGTAGHVLRPLSARNLQPTIAEEKGWIDREKLYGITGRSRKEQKKLAEELGISEYPESGGGCRLTYKGFARKMKDLIDHKEPDDNDVFLLQAGRHFRTSEHGKAIVGKNEEDNERLKKLAREGDMLFEVFDGKGPTVLLRDGETDKDRILAACLCVSHSKLGRDPYKPVRMWNHGSNRMSIRQVAPLDTDAKEKLRI